jgi:hypothetical protein
VSAGDKDAETNSPVCYARKADPGYMGFASRDELNAFLADLLESERALAEKLRSMLPRVRDDELHAEMKAILLRHEENIAKILSHLSA